MVLFQAFTKNNLIPGQTFSNISWIGSIQGFFLVAVGIFAGPLYDQGYLRGVISVGGFFVVLGLMMTSLCTKYWHLVLAQGVMIGFGIGCLFIPSIALLPSYFAKRRALAVGIGLSGSSLGGVVYPIVFYRLQPRIGFGWATRIIGFMALAMMLLPIMVMRMRYKPSSVRKMFDTGTWKELSWCLFTLMVFAAFTGLLIPFFYIQVFALQNGLVDANLGSYLVPIVNAGSFFGRIMSGQFADKVGPLNALIPCTLATSVLAFGWIRIHDSTGVIIFSALYGFFSGSFISLSILTVAALCPTLSVIGIRLGMAFIPMSVGTLIGNPIAGAILKSGWTGLQAFCGGIMMCAGILAIAVRITKHGLKIFIRA